METGNRENWDWLNAAFDFTLTAKLLRKIHLFDGHRDAIKHHP
jgi:hypothetical protein